MFVATALLGIFGNSHVDAEDKRIIQTWELTTPEAVNTYLCSKPNLLSTLKSDVGTLSSKDWEKMNNFPQNSRKLQYIYNKFDSWGTLQALVNEGKMIVEIKKTATWFVIGGCIIQEGNPEKPFWNAFIIATIDEKNK